MPKADVTAVLSGNTVPGKYIRSMPMSMRELQNLVPSLSGYRILGGSAADSPAAGFFDASAGTDLAATVFDVISGRGSVERLRTLDEWNRWMLLGSVIVRQHPDFPMPLIAEIETYRGCHRYASGGCSYCIEPLKGRPLMRRPADVIEEAVKLRELGVRNIRVGGQTCIVSYGSGDTSGTPRPSPDTVSELFTELGNMGFGVLHVDNANPAVISSYPEESEEILRTLAGCCTSGNVLALGMESADLRVIEANNLNSTPEQTMDAVRLINRVGSERGCNGMPKLLPGINLIAGLDGETPDTYVRNLEFLRSVLGEGLMLRRINIRQVMPVRRRFGVRIDPSSFRRHKQNVREEIDRRMLERVVPRGTVLRDVYTELADGNITFGRQIGSYPLLIGIPYPVRIGEFRDVTVTDWGFRSVTAVEYPFRINEASMTAISSLPGIGKKRSASIVRYRPYASADELGKVIDDAGVLDTLLPMLTFDVSRR
jgi:radical SAM superfamily enzyme with C-terminal helix-hairpin-helix motif